VSRPQPLITIVDAALSKKAFDTLSRQVLALGNERLRSSYQTTFWFAFGSEPRTVIEQSAESLVKRLPPARLRGVIGVEWWLSRMRTSNVKVDFHRDRDNALFDATGRTVNPRTSSLLYLTDSRGGLLAVTRLKPDPSRPALAPDTRAFDLAAPAPNRFVFFDGRLTHGVLDANNQVPTRRLRTEPAWRIGVAINFWHRRPSAVPTWAESRHYRALAAR
jgi:hypothetical protein